MTDNPATEADTQPEQPPTDQEVQAAADDTHEHYGSSIPDEELALLSEDPTAPNPYTDDEDADTDGEGES